MSAQVMTAAPGAAGTATGCGPTAPGSDAGAAEKGLVAALRQRQPQAYERLVRQHGPALQAVARRYLCNDSDARDTVQESFLLIFQRIDQFSGDSPLYAWMHRIVVNSALMRLRTARRQQEQSLEPLLPRFQDDGHQVTDTQPWRASAEAELADHGTRLQVRAAIDRLPDSHRTVLLLRDIEELDTEQTAALLQISEGAVKVRLHRARQALRALLEPLFADAAPPADSAAAGSKSP